MLQSLRSNSWVHILERSLDARSENDACYLNVLFLIFIWEHSAHDSIRAYHVLRSNGILRGISSPPKTVSNWAWLRTAVASMPSCKYMSLASSSVIPHARAAAITSVCE